MKFFKLWLPVFGWCWVIFYLSSIPRLDTGWGVWDLILRKAAHITEYFILTLLLYRAFKGSFNLSSFYLSIWTFSLSFLYAVSDEIHQAFIPTRNPSPNDVFFDALGIIAFYLLIKYKNKFSKKIAFGDNFLRFSVVRPFLIKGIRKVYPFWIRKALYTFLHHKKGVNNVHQRYGNKNHPG